MSRPRQWRLSWHLAGLLLLSCVLACAIVGSALLVVRMRQIEAAQQGRLAREAMLFAGREEAALRAVASVSISSRPAASNSASQCLTV